VTLTDDSIKEKERLRKQYGKKISDLKEKLEDLRLRSAHERNPERDRTLRRQIRETQDQLADTHKEQTAALRVVDESRVAFARARRKADPWRH
jgi:hypothetical protein